MARRRWLYTEKGKPLPGGPVEVPAQQKPDTQAAPGTGSPTEPAPKPAPGAWTDFALPGEKR